MFNGKPRKMVLHADRNGYFFTLDRVTGEHLVTGKVLRSRELGEGDQRQGRSRSAIRPRIPTVAGSLVSPNNGGATNWPPPATRPIPVFFMCRRTKPTRCTI